MAQLAPWPLSTLPHYAAPYVLLLVLIGASASTSRSAAANAAGCFFASVVAYYVVVELQFGAFPTAHAGAWSVAALTVCPLAAGIVGTARLRDGFWVAVVAAVAGAVALSDGAVGNIVRIAAGRGDAAFGQPVLAVADLIVAGVAVGVVPRNIGTRSSAVALLVPFAIVATWVGWALRFGTGPYL